MPQPTSIQFSEKLNFPDIIMEQIKACLKSRSKSIQDYCLEVENLCDAMVSYWDKSFNAEMKNLKLNPNTNKPYFNQLEVSENREESARKVFMCVMKLIQRSGFISEKTVEGLLDERTIDNIINSITKHPE